jgi:cellulose biosynthesis protein BcsE
MPQLAKALHLDALGLLPGRLYAVVYDDWRSMLEVSLTALLANSNNVPANLVTKRNLRREISNINPELSREIRSSVSTQSVRIYDWQSDTLFENLPLATLAELDMHGVGDGALVIINDVSSFFSNNLKGSLIQYRNWAEQRNCTLLLLYPFQQDVSDPTINIRQFADLFAGFARLKISGSDLLWNVFHWFGHDMFSSAQTLKLTREEDKSTLCAVDVAPQNNSIALAADEDSIIAVKTALHDGESAPNSWCVLENLDSLVDACSGAVASTIILSFDSKISLDTLSRVAFKIRKSCGNRVKIVVREVAHHFRNSQEQLILRLGATLVIPFEAGMSRLLNLVAAIQGQQFSHQLSANYDDAVAGNLLPTSFGYITPTEFFKKISATLEHVKTLNIENALVKLTPVSGMPPLDVLKYCSASRPGDYFTADQNDVYMLLFTCRAGDISSTLDRLFRLPASELFESEVRYTYPESIQDALEELDSRANIERFPDIGQALAQATSQPSNPKMSEPRKPDRLHKHRHTPPLARRHSLAILNAQSREHS